MLRTMNREWPWTRGEPSRRRGGVSRIRGGFVAFIVLALVSLGLASSAAAAPVVTFKVKTAPIPGFPGTGNILGAGAAVEVEANDASVTGFTVKVGAAYKKGKKTHSYYTQPKTCPKGGFPTKMVMKFMSGETVTVPEHVPCPLKR